ncbi:DUF6497 family protein [Sulfitobacter sp. D35]|uniref:DUF6497 family protein n=1 Tax=Sulfitobacter sp. D35 TaxID=3083252 RepID=UPI00296F6EDA|nr:DUF6497 family protein [Sulfitobacter sp. D35]MDW4499571.1 DUF6497 family protein [Sulfitobacter sp. D35]
MIVAGVSCGPLHAMDVPSGQDVELSEVLVETVGEETWLRFRFLAPEIAADTGGLAFGDVEDDLEYLCSRLALPYIEEFDLAGNLVIVTLQDRPVAFGQSDPDATQYIDAFRIDTGDCIWEAY